MFIPNDLCLLGPVYPEAISVLLYIQERDIIVILGNIFVKVSVLGVGLRRDAAFFYGTPDITQRKRLSSTSPAGLCLA